MVTRREFLIAGGGASCVIAVGAVIAQDGARPFSAFLPANYDPSKDDCSDAFRAASRWSAENNKPVSVAGKLLLGTVAVLDQAGASFRFDGAEIRVRDDGCPGRPAAAAFGEAPMGLLVRADRVSLLGSARFIGLGTPGRTGLYGIWFDQVASARVGKFHFERMALGQVFMCCDDASVGDTTSELMYGTQNGGKEGAGSAQVIAGCRNSTFGRLNATNNDKPMRYLSPGVATTGEPRDNRGNNYGLVEGTGRPGSPWSQAIAIRSSVDSVFEGAKATGVTAVLLIEKYDSDDRWDVRDNRIALIEGEVLDTPSSMDGGIMINNYGKRTLGETRIAQVRLRGPISVKPPLPQTFGIYVTDGTLTIGTAQVEGFTFQIDAYDCRLVIDAFTSDRAGYEVFRYGRGLTGRIGRMTIRSGIAGPAGNAGLIRAVDLGRSSAPPDFDVVEASYVAGGARSAAEYVQYDPLYAAGRLRIGKLTGRGTRGDRASRPN